MKAAKESKAKKVVASLLLFTFTFSTVVWSAPAGALIQTAASLSVDGIRVSTFVSQLEIPENIGTIQTRYQAAEDNGQTIVHLQDAHASLDAQRSISKILETLIRDYDIDTVFVEGAAVELQNKNLKFHENRESNEALIDLLVEDGLVSGAELYLIKSQHPPARMLGVEDVQLYRENLESFRDVYSRSQSSTDYLEQIKIDIATQASRVFNKTLNHFFKEWVFYQDNQGLLLRHLEMLQKYAIQQLDVDFNDSRQQLDWPQLVRYSKLLGAEKNLRLETAKEELRHLVQRLAAEHMDAGYREAIANYNPARGFEIHKMNPQTQLMFKKGTRFFVEGFLDQARVKGFKLETYPELFKAWGVSVLREEMDASRLFEEIGKITEALLEKMAVTDKEKELLSIYQDYLLLVKTLRLELTEKEETVLRAKEDALRPSTLEKELRSTQDTTQADSPRREKELQSLKDVDQAFEQALLFYRQAKARDEVIFNNMMRQMKDLKKQKAVLITGGFHTEGLSRHMQNQNVSYAQIMPHIAEVLGNKAYVNAMTLGGGTNPKEATIPVVRAAQPEVFLAQNFPAEVSYLRQRVETHSAVVNARATKRSEVRKNEVVPSEHETQASKPKSMEWSNHLIARAIRWLLMPGSLIAGMMSSLASSSTRPHKGYANRYNGNVQRFIETLTPRVVLDSEMGQIIADSVLEGPAIAGGAYLAEGEAPEIQTVVTQSQDVPAGWIRPAGSNAGYAFREYSRDGVVTLQLMSLADNTVQDLAEQKSSTVTGQASTFFSRNYTVSPTDYPGGPVVVYQIGSSSYRGSSTSVKVQRVSDPGQVLVIPSRFTTESSFVGAEFGENGALTVLTEHSSYHVRVQQPVVVAADGITRPDLTNTEIPLQLIHLTGDVNVSSETPVAVVSLSRTGNGDGYQVAVFDTSRELGTADMRYIRNVAITADSKASFTFVKSYGSSLGRSIVAVGLDADHANHVVFVDAKTGEILRPVLDATNLGKTEAIVSEKSRVGDRVTFNTVRQDGTPGADVTVDLQTLTFETEPAANQYGVLKNYFAGLTVVQGSTPPAYEVRVYEGAPYASPVLFVMPLPEGRQEEVFSAVQAGGVDYLVVDRGNNTNEVDVVVGFTGTPFTHHFDQDAHVTGLRALANGDLEIRTTSADQRDNIVRVLRGDLVVSTARVPFAVVPTQSEGTLTPLLLQHIPKIGTQPSRLQTNLVGPASAVISAETKYLSITDESVSVRAAARDQGVQIILGTGVTNAFSPSTPRLFKPQDALTLSLQAVRQSQNPGQAVDAPIPVRVELVGRQDYTVPGISYSLSRQVADSVVVMAAPGEVAEIPLSAFNQYDFSVPVQFISIINADTVPLEITTTIANYPVPQISLQSTTLRPGPGEPVQITGSVQSFEPERHQLQIFAGNQLLADHVPVTNGVFNQELNLQRGTHDIRFKVTDIERGWIVSELNTRISVTPTAGTLQPLAAGTPLNALSGGRSILYDFNRITSARPAADDSFTKEYGGGITPKMPFLSADFGGQVVVGLDQVAKAGVALPSSIRIQVRGLNELNSLLSDQDYIVSLDSVPGTQTFAIPFGHFAKITSISLLPDFGQSQVPSPRFTMQLSSSDAQEFRAVSADKTVADISLPKDTAGNAPTINVIASSGVAQQTDVTATGVHTSFTATRTGDYLVQQYRYAAPADWTNISAIDVGVLKASTRSDLTPQEVRLEIKDVNGKTATVQYTDFTLGREHILSLPVNTIAEIAARQKQAGFDISKVASVAAVHVFKASETGTLDFDIDPIQVGGVVTPSLDFYNSDINAAAHTSLLSVNLIGDARIGLDGHDAVTMTNGGLTYTTPLTRAQLNADGTGRYIFNLDASAAGPALVTLTSAAAEGQQPEVQTYVLRGLDSVVGGGQLFALPISLPGLAHVEIRALNAPKTGETPVTYTMTLRASDLEFSTPDEHLFYAESIAVPSVAGARFQTVASAGSPYVGTLTPLGSRGQFRGPVAEIRDTRFLAHGISYDNTATTHPGIQTADWSQAGQVRFYLKTSETSAKIEVKDSRGGKALVEFKNLVPGYWQPVQIDTAILRQVSELQGTPLSLNQIHTLFAIIENLPGGQQHFVEVATRPSSNPRDTTLQGITSPISALVVINLLNDPVALAALSPSARLVYNANRDGAGELIAPISPIDVLVIFNELNARSVTGEAEAPSVQTPLPQNALPVQNNPGFVYEVGNYGPTKTLSIFETTDGQTVSRLRYIVPEPGVREISNVRVRTIHAVEYDSVPLDLPKKQDEDELQPQRQTYETYTREVDEVLPDQDWLFETLDIDLDALTDAPQRRSEVRELSAGLKDYGRSLPAVILTARISSDTISSQLPRPVFEALLDLVTPKIAKETAIAQTDIRQALERRMAELQVLAALKILPMDVEGSVILSADQLAKRQPVLLAMMPFIALLSSAEKRQSFFFTGAEAADFKQLVLNPKHSGLTPEEMGRVTRLFHFASPVDPAGDLRKHIEREKRLDIAVTASVSAEVSQLYAEVLESILRNIESRSEFSNLKTADQVAAAAEAFAVRAYMLLSLAKYLKAELTKKQPEPVKDLIARFFNNMGISDVSVNANGTFELSLQSVSQYLSALKAAQTALAKSA